MDKELDALKELMEERPEGGSKIPDKVEMVAFVKRLDEVRTEIIEENKKRKMRKKRKIDERDDERDTPLYVPIPKTADMIRVRSQAPQIFEAN